MAQILGTKARILKAVAFPTCWCPQLLGCCAEQFTLLEISTAFCGTNAKIYIWKGREGVKERLKLKTPKIKNKREKDPQTKKRSKWKIREIFLLLEKVFHHLICLASVQTFILHSGSCGFLVLCPSPGVPVPCHWFAWARLCNCPSVGRTGEWESKLQGMGSTLVAAQCLGNRISAQLYFTGTDTSPARGYTWSIVQIKGLLSIRDCFRSWTCWCRESWQSKKWDGRAAETLQNPSALHNWQIRNRLCKLRDIDDFDTQNVFRRRSICKGGFLFLWNFWGGRLKINASNVQSCQCFSATLVSKIQGSFVGLYKWFILTVIVCSTIN